MRMEDCRVTSFLEQELRGCVLLDNTAKLVAKGSRFVAKSFAICCKANSTFTGQSAGSRF